MATSSNMVTVGSLSTMKTYLDNRYYRKSSSDINSLLQDKPVMLITETRESGSSNYAFIQTSVPGSSGSTASDLAYLCNNVSSFDVLLVTDRLDAANRPLAAVVDVLLDNGTGKSGETVTSCRGTLFKAGSTFSENYEDYTLSLVMESIYSTKLRLMMSTMTLSTDENADPVVYIGDLNTASQAIPISSTLYYSNLNLSVSANAVKAKINSSTSIYQPGAAICSMKPVSKITNLTSLNYIDMVNTSSATTATQTLSFVAGTQLILANTSSSAVTIAASATMLARQSGTVTITASQWATKNYEVIAEPFSSSGVLAYSSTKITTCSVRSGDVINNGSAALTVPASGYIKLTFLRMS